MATAPFSGGPLTQSDLLGIWVSVVDDSYSEPFLLAGDGGGLEAWTQSFAQLARVSEAVDVSMESLFILPWSGQTNPPASGPNQATVTLTLSRTGLLEQPLILGAGLVWVDDVEPDYSPAGTKLVATGLRYTLTEDLVFEPGESGPLSVEAIAERPGYGYNNPLPGMLNTIEQPGAGYYNAEAAVSSNVLTTPAAANALASTQVTCTDVPHVFIPALVGQYLAVTQGLNAGRVARVVAYRPPPPSDADGGQVGLEMLVAVHASTFAGAFAPGELVAVSFVTAGYAVFKHSVQVGPVLKMSFVLRCGNVAPGSVLTGTSSGATATVDLVYQDASRWQGTTPSVVPSTESWRVLGWVADWGLSVTNVLQPSGGTAGVLDLLGRERNLPRGASEPDDAYRQRVAGIADVVTPNAVRRRLNKTLTQGPLRLAWTLREVGSAFFPGFFYGDGGQYGDFYDYDATVLGGMGTGAGYQADEPVRQTTGGVVATGKILIRGGVPATPFVPGQAATTGVQSAATVVGVAGLRQGYPFVAGVPIVGTLSGFSSTPSSATPSAGIVYASNGVALEVGSPLLPGTPLPTLWRIYVDYLRMRAYFAIEAARSGFGDFGFGWGNGNPGVGALADWWDSGPAWNDFYDGAAVGAAKQYLQALGAVSAIKAGGVTVELLPAPNANWVPPPAALPPGPTSGMKLWLKGDVGLFSSPNTWSDQSGFGHDLIGPGGGGNPTAGTGIDGKATADFNGSSQYFETAPGVTLAQLVSADFLSVFVVAKYTGSTDKLGDLFTPPVLIDTGGLLGVFSYDSSGAGKAWGTTTAGSNTGLISGGFTLGNAQLISFVQNGVAVSGNGQSLAIGLGAPVVEDGVALVGLTGRLCLGFYVGAGAVHFQGSIGEVIVYDRALTNGEQAATKAYLAGKWGL